MSKDLKNAIIFLIITVAVTWALYLPIALLGWNPYEMPGFILLFFGGSAPTWTGVIMMLATYDKAERKDYLQRLYQVKRIGTKWWLVIVLLFPAVVALSIGVNAALGGAMPDMANLNAVIANPVLFFPLIGMSFLSGPFSEELGWRGFALGPLMKRFGFAGGNVLLGVVWGLWHLPLFFMPQTWHGRIGVAGFAAFMMLSIGLAVIMGWVYVHTKRSILSAMLLHLMSNFTAQLAASASGVDSMIYEIARCLIVVLIGAGIVVYGQSPEGCLQSGKSAR